MLLKYDTGVGGLTGRVNNIADGAVRQIEEARAERSMKSNKVQRATNVHAQRIATGGLPYHSRHVPMEQSAELNRQRSRADAENNNSTGSVFLHFFLAPEKNEPVC